MTRASRVPQPTLDLSRRSLFGAVLGIGALATLQACGGDAEGGSGGDGGGTVKWAWQMPTTWDPVTSSAGSDVQMLALTYSALTFIDDQGNAVAGLVESWKYAKDGTTVTFTLRSRADLQRRQPARRGGRQEEPRAGPRRRQLADRRAAGGPDRRDDRRPRVHPRARPPQLPVPPPPRRQDRHGRQPRGLRVQPGLAGHPAGRLGPVHPRLLRAELQGGAAQERQVLRGRRHHDHELRALPGGGRGHRGRRRCSRASTTSACCPAASSRRPRPPASRCR